MQKLIENYLGVMLDSQNQLFVHFMPTGQTSQLRLWKVEMTSEEKSPLWQTTQNTKELNTDDKEHKVSLSHYNVLISPVHVHFYWALP